MTGVIQRVLFLIGYRQEYEINQKLNPIRSDVLRLLISQVIAVKLVIWRTRLDSNQRPSPSEGDALSS